MTGKTGKCPKLLSSDSSPRSTQGSCSELDVELLRDRAAELLLSQRDKINRRIHSRMLQSARKIADTEDVLSTALRRLDSLIIKGSMRAQSDAQLFALAHQVIERTIREKARNARRLKRRELIAEELAASARVEGIVPTQDLLVRIGRLSNDATDKEIALLRARGIRLHEIAESLGLPDAVVRKRWSRLKIRAREIMSEGENHDHH